MFFQVASFVAKVLKKFRLVSLNDEQVLQFYSSFHHLTTKVTLVQTSCFRIAVGCSSAVKI